MRKKSEEESQLFDLIGCMLEYDVYRRITLEEALANAAKTHDGYFVVPQIIEQDE